MTQFLIAGGSVLVACAMSVVAGRRRTRAFWIVLALANAAIWIPALYIEGQGSVRRAAYVQFYPAPTGWYGPFMGECLRKPEGVYCAQERE